MIHSLFFKTLFKFTANNTKVSPDCPGKLFFLKNQHILRVYDKQTVWSYCRLAPATEAGLTAQRRRSDSHPQKKAVLAAGAGRRGLLSNYCRLHSPSATLAFVQNPQQKSTCNQSWNTRVQTCDFMFAHVEEGRVKTKYTLTVAHVRAHGCFMWLM